MALLMIPVIVVFWTDECGIGIDEVFYLQTIFSAVVLVLEVPSGYVADVLGRKRTLFLSSILTGLGFTIYALAHGFGLLVAAEAVLAVGLSLWSGTDVAMQYETIHELGRPGEALASESRNLSVRQATEAAVAVAGGYLAVWLSLRATVWLTVVPYVASAVLVLLLVEPARGVRSDTSVSQAWGYVREAIGRSEIRRPILVWAFLSTGTLLGVWMHQLLWMRAGLAVQSFGWAWAALNAAVSASALLAVRFRDRWGWIGSVALLAAWEMAALAVMGVWMSRWVFAAGCALNVVRGVGYPIVVTEVNSRIGSDRRATILSVVHLGGRLLFAALALPVGWIALRWGLTEAAVVAGLATGGGALVLLGATRRSKGRLKVES